MDGYEMEVAAQRRMQTMLDEAENRRLLRMVAARPISVRSWRPRLAFTIVRRLARGTGAS